MKVNNLLGCSSVLRAASSLFHRSIMKPLWISLLFLSLLFPLLGQDAYNIDPQPLSRYNAMIIKYTSNLHVDNRLGLGVDIPVSPWYIIETDFINLSWTNSDPFNKNRRSFSIFPVVDLSMIYLMSAALPRDKQETLWLLPLFFTNSSHNLFFLGNPDYQYNHEKIGFNVAAFVKNSTNLYPFRKHAWMDTAPGMGLKLYYGGGSVDLGIQRKWRFVNDTGTSHVDEIFFSVTGHIYDFSSREMGGSERVATVLINHWLSQ